MIDFWYEYPIARVVFRPGAVDSVGTEVAALGVERVLLIATGSAADVAARIVDQLGDRLVGVFDTVIQHVPQRLAEAARLRAEDLAADVVVSVGGGSATGLAKAVAVARGVPIVAVPTTYAGSEATPVYGITGTHKITGRDPRARPRVVVYDPDLTMGMPPRLTATSGLNAVAHAVQAPAGPSANPISTMYGLEALRWLRDALPRAVHDDPHARAQALLGAHLAGTAFAGAGSGLHHKLCHVLGGDLGLGHADVHAVLLPHVVAYQQSIMPDAFAPVAAVLAGGKARTALHVTAGGDATSALGTTAGGDAASVSGMTGGGDAASALRALAGDLGAPVSLAEIGAPAERLPAVAEHAARELADAGVRPLIDEARLRELLDDAHSGRPPKLYP
ncbi:MAG TPA: maleylacetate reductase [Micromonosporaceae bacterium]